MGQPAQDENTLVYIIHGNIFGINIYNIRFWCYDISYLAEIVCRNQLLVHIIFGDNFWFTSHIAQIMIDRSAFLVHIRYLASFCSYVGSKMNGRLEVIGCSALQRPHTFRTRYMFKKIMQILCFACYLCNFFRMGGWTWLVAMLCKDPMLSQQDVMGNKQ